MRSCAHGERDRAGAQAARRGGVRRAPRGDRRGAPAPSRSGRGARAPAAGGRAHAREPVGGPADGGLGRHHRRPPDGPRAPPVAPVRAERRGARLGRRSGRGARPTAGRTRTSSRSGPSRSATSRRSAAELLAGHAEATGGGPAPLIGLQLTHSGRWSRPTGTPAPQIAFRHPVLDDRSARPMRTSSRTRWLDDLVGAYARRGRRRARGRVRLRGREALSRLPAARAARRARAARALRRRPRQAGPGSSTATVAAIRRDAPGPADRGAALGLRRRARTSAGPTTAASRPPPGAYPYAFGGDGTGARHRPRRGAHAVRAAGGPRRAAALRHRGQPVLLPARPAARVLPAVGRVPSAARPAARSRAPARGHGRDHPGAPGAHGGRERAVVPPGVDAGGRGGRRRRVAAQISSATAAGSSRTPSCPPTCSPARDTERARLCRTFSDCTTAPRNGLISGCYPLDPYYKARPERLELTAAKRAAGELT